MSGAGAGAALAYGRDTARTRMSPPPLSASPAAASPWVSGAGMVFPVEDSRVGEHVPYCAKATEQPYFFSSPADLVMQRSRTIKVCFTRSCASWIHPESRLRYLSNCLRRVTSS